VSIRPSGKGKLGTMCEEQKLVWDRNFMAHVRAGSSLTA